MLKNDSQIKPSQQIITLTETNIAPGNWWSEDDFFFWDAIVLGAILVSGRVSNFNKRSPASEMEQSLVVSFIVMNPRLCACSMPSKRQKDSPKWCDLPWCKVKTTLNRSENSWWNSLKFMVMNHHQDRNRIKQSQQISKLDIVIYVPLRYPVHPSRRLKPTLERSMKTSQSATQDVSAVEF